MKKHLFFLSLFIAQMGLFSCQKEASPLEETDELVKEIKFTADDRAPQSFAFSWTSPIAIKVRYEILLNGLPIAPAKEWTNVTTGNQTTNVDVPAGAQVTARFKAKRGSSNAITTMTYSLTGWCIPYNNQNVTVNAPTSFPWASMPYNLSTTCTY